MAESCWFKAVCSGGTEVVSSERRDGSAGWVWTVPVGQQELQHKLLQHTQTLRCCPPRLWWFWAWSLMEARPLRWCCCCASLLMWNHDHLDQQPPGNLQVEDRDTVAPVTSYLHHLAPLECEFLSAVRKVQTSVVVTCEDHKFASLFAALVPPTGNIKGRTDEMLRV